MHSRFAVTCGFSTEIFMGRHRLSLRFFHLRFLRLGVLFAKSLFQNVSLRPLPLKIQQFMLLRGKWPLAATPIGLSNNLTHIRLH